MSLLLEGCPLVDLSVRGGSAAGSATTVHVRQERFSIVKRAWIGWHHKLEGKNDMHPG